MEHHAHIMQRNDSISHLPNRKRSILRFILLIAIFAIATPALADYLGPDRVVTETTSACKVVLYECRYVPSKNHYDYVRAEDWSCSNESKPWKAYPDMPSSQGCFEATVGDQYWGQEATVQEVTITYPPATITRSVQNCTFNNGWCITSPRLSLSGSEPVQGYEILAIEGTLNGQTFACSGANCSVPLNEGNNNSSYWAISSWGDTSTMGTVAVKVDTKNPVLTASLSGMLGSNNWYTDAQLNASASDPAPGSGLAALEYELDASSWATFPEAGVLTLPDGKHTVDVRAVDTAGRAVSTSKSFWLDTVAPNVSLEPTGTLGSNGWYTTNLNLTASPSDSTSGVDLFEYSLNSDAWKTYITPLTLADGTHKVSFWAQDFAGLATQVDRTYKVDTRVPQINGSLSGIPGANGWYISNVTLSLSASDPAPGSGIDAFTYTLNGGIENSYTDAIVLSNGQHKIEINTRDKAGLTYSTEQAINVDTIYPALNVQTTLPNWINNSIDLNGTAADHGSKLSKVEISTDGGQTWQKVNGTTNWVYIWDTQNSPNGNHDIHVRAIDNAGLITKRNFTAGVDNRAPRINLPDSWYQWDTVRLDIWDDESGLSEARVEIRDPEGRWPVRIIRLGLEDFPLEFKWDRRFGDDTVAPLGTYDLKVIAFDHLGNVAHQGASIKILLDILPAGPTATLQPISRPTEVLTTPTPIASPITTPTQAAVVSVFGTTPDPAALITPVAQAVSTPRAAPTQTGVLDWLQSVFDQEPQAEDRVTKSPVSMPLPASRSPNAHSNVLWGAAAAGVIGAATAQALEEKRRREEEAARHAEQVRAEVDARNEAIQASQEAKREALFLQNWLQGQAILNAQIEEAKKQGASAEQLAALREMGATQGFSAAIDRTAQLTQSLANAATRRDELVERKEQQVEAQARFYSAESEDWEDDYNAYMAQRAIENWRAAEQQYYPPPAKEEPEEEEEKSWWENALGWIDEHQQEIALGIGVAVGIGAIVLSGGVATPLVAAAWVAGAAAVAAGTVAVGTAALNVHYGREWHANIGTNIAIAGIAAAVVSGGWFLLQTVTTAAGSYCAVNTTICARVEPIFQAIDMAEQLWLQTKLAYQTSIHSPEAANTALELQMEYLDGGMPGNAVAKEVGEEVLEGAARYGDEALDLITLYGADAARIIANYGDEGIAILQKYGDDAVDLVKDYGISAVKVMEAVDPEAARNLLKTLDDDVLDYALEQGPDAVSALSRWSAEDLRKHGVELALRAKKDAKALADVKKLLALGPIDPKHLTPEQRKLINEIAANSTQYADEGQVVLGKWVDSSSGFVEAAQDTGSVHYNPHPDLWNMLGDLGQESQDEVAWLINRQVVQTGINKGLPFEYTLSGIPVDKISREKAAFEAIFDGASNTELMSILKTDYLPVRIQEILELQKAGYKFSFDKVTNSYILVP